MADLSKMPIKAQPSDKRSQLQREMEEASMIEQRVQTGTRMERDPMAPGAYIQTPVYETRRVQDPASQKMLREQKFGSAARQLDMMKGREQGQEIFKDQLGRVQQGRSADMAAILGQRKQQAEQGLGAEAFQAAREQRLRSLGSNELRQQRNLAALQGRSGIRGGAAAGQLAELMGSQMRDRQSAEQQLLLADAALKQGMLDKYANQLQGVEQEELGREKFNIGQKQKELFGELSTGLNEQAMGVAERTGVRQGEAAQAMAAAMAAASGGGGKK